MLKGNEMKSQTEMLMDLEEMYLTMRSAIEYGAMSRDDIEGFTAEEYNEMGSRVVPKMNVMNCIELMNMNSEMKLVSNKQFKASLRLDLEGDRYKIYLGKDRISMTLNDRKIIQFIVEDVMLSGKKKLMVMQQIMAHSELLDTSSNNGWDMYKVKYNGLEYTVGFMEAENGTVCFMKDFVEFMWVPNEDDYYTEIRANSTRGKTQRHSANDMGDIGYLWNEYERCISTMETAESEAEYWRGVIDEAVRNGDVLKDDA